MALYKSVYKYKNINAVIAPS